MDNYYYIGRICQHSSQSILKKEIPLAFDNYRHYIASVSDQTVFVSLKFFTEDSASGEALIDWISTIIQTPKKWKAWGKRIFFHKENKTGNEIKKTQ